MARALRGVEATSPSGYVTRDARPNRSSFVETAAARGFCERLTQTLLYPLSTAASLLMSSILCFKSRSVTPNLFASLLALASLPSLGACSREDSVRVTGDADQIYGYTPSGARVEATLVDDGDGQRHVELLLPDGGSVEVFLSRWISPSQGIYNFVKRVHGVRPGDSIELSPYGLDEIPEGCLCQTADDPELDLDRVDAFVAISDGERRTFRRYSERPVPSTDVRWYLSCETLDYAELREQIGMMKCGAPRRI